MKTIYVSGPMTGMPDLNFLAFNRIAAELRAQGHAVMNPAEKADEGKPGMEWEDYMRQDIKMLMDCDTIFMLPGWSHSRGAKLERMLAVTLGFEITGYVA